MQTYKTWTTDSYKKYPERVDFSEFDSIKITERLRDAGLCILKNVPTDNEQMVLQVAKRFGSIMDTFYGLSWDVKSVPNAKNIAYTSKNLGLHMDLLYYKSPPGLQLLHCLKNSVQGGESLFLDSFKAVELLKSRFPESYKILKEFPVVFNIKMMVRIGDSSIKQ